MSNDTTRTQAMEADHFKNRMIQECVKPFRVSHTHLKAGTTTGLRHSWSLLWRYYIVRFPYFVAHFGLNVFAGLIGRLAIRPSKAEVVTHLNREQECIKEMFARLGIEIDEAEYPPLTEFNLSDETYEALLQLWFHK